MSVPVHYATGFYEDLVAQTEWFHDNVSANFAGRWYDAAMATAAGLADWPRSYGYAREHGTAQFPGPASCGRRRSASAANLRTGSSSACGWIGARPCRSRS